MDNITGDKGLYNKFVSLDGDWTKNKVHSYVLIVLIGYFATKILYSAAYKVYSYESLENEVLSFGLLMILTGIIFLACQIENRAVIGGKSGANWLFFFGLMLGINLPMIYRETMFKDTSDDKETHYLLYTLVIIIILLSIGLTLVSTEKKMQYALYSFVLLIISITTIMARINKMPNEEAFTVDIYTTGDSDSDKKLKDEINQNETEINMLRNQLKNIQKTHGQTDKKLSDLEHNHNQLLGKHSALLSSSNENSCPQDQKKRKVDIANYYMAAGAFAISLLLTSDSKDNAVNGFISILQGTLLGGVISGIAVGVFKRSSICGTGDSSGGESGPNDPSGYAGCKPYIYQLNDTANSILYVTAGILIIGSFVTAFYLGRDKGFIWSLGLFFIALPVIALVLYIMVLGAREKIKNPHCTSSGTSQNTHLIPGIPSEPGIPSRKNSKCEINTNITSFLNSVSFPSFNRSSNLISPTQSDSVMTEGCSCNNLNSCEGKQSVIKNEKYNPVYLILLVVLSIVSISGGIHEAMRGSIMSMIIFLVLTPIILSSIFLPLFFKDLHKKLIFHFNLKDIYTKCCQSSGHKGECFSYISVSNSKTYGLFIGSAFILLLIGISAYSVLKNKLLLIGAVALSSMCIVTVIILKVVMKMNNFHFGLDSYIGLTDLIVAKKESDVENSDISAFSGMQNAERRIRGDDFTINKKYTSDLQRNIDNEYTNSTCAVFNQGRVITMPKNVCKILYYSSKRAKPCLITNYKHKGCDAFESCTYSGTSNVLGSGINSVQLGEGFIEIYTCTRDSWKTGAGILTIVLVLVLIMFGVSHFLNKQASRIKAV